MKPKILFRGFTLVEVAVVFFVVGILMSQVLVTLSEQLEQQQVQLTQQRLEEIKEALLGYAVIYRNLPCPARDINGIAIFDKTLQQCGVYPDEGYLPWATLGVSQYDAWGHPFRYRVDFLFSNPQLPNYGDVNCGTKEFPPLPPCYRVGYNLDADDNFTIQDLQNNPLVSSDNAPAAIIFSCGRNGMPDGENDADSTSVDSTPCSNDASWYDATYVQDKYVPNGFDDILTWIPRNLLANRLVMAHQWYYYPPP